MVGEAPADNEGTGRGFYAPLIAGRPSADAERAHVAVAGHERSGNASG
jgi:hypothetical protein